MPGNPQFDAIAAARDKALGALADAVTTIGNEIAVTVAQGPYLDRLTKRYQDLLNERAAIAAAATNAVLAMPSVIAAVATLNDLATKMNASAAELPTATNALTTTATILSLGQQFSDIITSAQK